MLEVINAEYVDGYKIYFQFNNGQDGIVDLEEALWGSVFEPLKNIEQFKKFEISATLHTIFWENEADLAPEFLYDTMVEQGHPSAVPTIQTSPQPLP